MSKTQEAPNLTRYLLGELPERERRQIEEEYFGDDDAFEQMLVAEEELMDAYVRGELSTGERARFEELFLASPRKRERVQFARSLAEAVSDARPVQASREATRSPAPSLLAALRARSAALRFALAAVSLAIVAGLSWLLVERARMREELRQLRAERVALNEKAQEVERRAAAERARNAETLAQLEAERARPTPEVVRQGEEAVSRRGMPQTDRSPRGRVKKDDAVIARHSPRKNRERFVSSQNAAVTRDSNREQITDLPLLSSVSFDLRPGLVRGGGAATLAVPGDATFILLRLNVDAELSHESYSAVIEDADGRPVWRADSFKPRRRAGEGGIVELPMVPTRDLPLGDYVLLLRGRRPDGSLQGVAHYSFRVVRK